MSSGSRTSQFSPLESHGILAVLAAQFVLTPLIPLAPDGLFAIGVHASYHVVLVALIAHAARHRRQIIICVALISLSALLRGTEFVSDQFRQVAANTAGMLALAMVLVLSIRRLFASTIVTPAMISAAIGVYLLAGLPFSMLYMIIEDLANQSFRTPDGLEPTPLDLYYFSYTTMTTLGYGDYSPASQTARSVALGQAIFGQMFVAVLIGRLVALQVTASLAAKEPGGVSPEHGSGM